MKTYNETIKKPRLVIQYDESAESPRTWSNVGHFFTKETRHNSPDGVKHPLYQIMVDTEQVRNSVEHMELIKKEARTRFLETKDEDLHIIEIFPVYRLEHGNVIYRRGEAKGYDHSNCGFYIVTAKSIEGETYTDESLVKQIDAELATYTQWCNGEVLQFAVYDEEGELTDSCSGLYSIEEIRGYLSGEWKTENLNEYMQNK